MKTRIFLTALILATGMLFAGVASGGDMMQGTTMGTTTPEHSKETATKILRTEQIREMQTLLQDRGYDVGEVNGAISPKTTQALQQFQEDRELAVTGTPTRETLRALSLSSAQQEFFGLSPQFGEMEEKMNTEHKEGLY